MKIPDTPELDKLSKQNKALHTQSIGYFLEWAGEQGYHLAEWRQFDDVKDPVFTYVGKLTEELLAEYAGIDLKKVEQERRALLEYQRWLNEEREQR